MAGLMILRKQMGTDVLKNCMNIVSGIMILVFDTVYKMFANSLSNFENHRTQTEYENAHIAKSFPFQFVNQYCAVFIIAYLMPFESTFGDLFGRCHCHTFGKLVSYSNSTYTCIDADVDGGNLNGCTCEYRSCGADAGNLLLSVFLTAIVVGNATEMLIPFIKGKISQLFLKMCSRSPSRSCNTQWRSKRRGWQHTA